MRWCESVSWIRHLFDAHLRPIELLQTLVGRGACDTRRRNPWWLRQGCKLLSTCLLRMVIDHYHKFRGRSQPLGTIRCSSDSQQETSARCQRTGRSAASPWFDSALEKPISSVGCGWRNLISGITNHKTSEESAGKKSVIPAVTVTATSPQLLIGPRPKCCPGTNTQNSSDVN